MDLQRRPDIRKPLASLAKTPPGMPGPIVMQGKVERRPSETTIWRHGTSWYNGMIHHGTRGALHHHVSGSHTLPAVGMVPLSQDESAVRRSAPSRSSSVYSSTSVNHTQYSSSGHSPFSRHCPVRSVVHRRQLTSSSRGGRVSPTIVRPRVIIAGNIVIPSETPTIVRPRVIIPSNIVIPRNMSPASSSDVKSSVTAPEEGDGIKRSTTDSWHSSPSTTPSTKRARTLFENNHQESSFDKLDLLCSATLELGPLSENPAGCSCPKSKCVALYCDCFKAGRRCSPTACTCLHCKNTVEESGANGARSKVRLDVLFREHTGKA
jgi:Tesmin/TSO1-like CXC domain, cysteine-rich domain